MSKTGTTLELSVPDTLLEQAEEVRVLHVDDDPEFGAVTKTFLERDREELTVLTEKSAVEGYRTQQQFWDALSMYQRLVEQDLAGVYIVQDGEFAYINSYLADLLDRDRETLLGIHLGEVVCGPEDEVEELLDQATERGPSTTTVPSSVPTGRPWRSNSSG